MRPLIRRATAAALLPVMFASAGCGLLRRDRIEHVLFSAHLACLTTGVASHLGAGGGDARAIAACVAAGAGLAKEASDASCGRGFDPIDLVADAAGVLAGIAAAGLFTSGD